MDINACLGETLQSPLHRACKSNSTDLAELLINSGADVNVRDIYGNTLLHLVASSGYTALVHLLLYFGADMNVTNMWDQTALLKAVQGGHVEVVEMLLNNDPTGAFRLNQDGESAVTIATEKVSFCIGSFGERLIS